MEAFKREDRSKGVRIQLRRGNESKAFTVHTSTELEKLRELLIKFLNKQ